jgi:lauroyl/myristoyl acyltransferase
MNAPASAPSATSAPAATKPATLSHRVEYIGTRLAVFGLGLLGWRAASWVGGLIGRLVYRPIGIRAGVVERQIAAAFPEFSRARVEEVAAGEGRRGVLQRLQTHRAFFDGQLGRRRSGFVGTVRHE